MGFSSVVINDLDLVSISLLPNKANSELIIDTDAKLAVTVLLQSFQPVPRGALQVLERICSVQHP
jgi:hypothetical protein